MRLRQARAPGPAPYLAPWRAAVVTRRRNTELAVISICRHAAAIDMFTLSKHRVTIKNIGRVIAKWTLGFTGKLPELPQKFQGSKIPDEPYRRSALQTVAESSYCTVQDEAPGAAPAG